MRLADLVVQSYVDRCKPILPLRWIDGRSMAGELHPTQQEEHRLRLAPVAFVELADEVPSGNVRLVEGQERLVSGTRWHAHIVPDVVVDPDGRTRARDKRATSAVPDWPPRPKKEEEPLADQGFLEWSGPASLRCPPAFQAVALPTELPDQGEPP